MSLSWLSGERVVIYGALVCFAFIVILLVGVLFTGNSAVRADFLAFHAAGRLAMGGEAAAAYDWSRLHAMQAEILGVAPEGLTGYLAWLNPPHFFFAVIPFQGLPYAWAWLAWIAACSVVFALAIRAVLPGPAAMVAAFCTPSVLICLGVGQNGLLVAALMAWTLALLDRRPVVAGLALGLLTIKPQFGLIFPLLLVATGRWTVVLAATVAALLAGLAALIAFGSETWIAFAEALPANSRYLLAENAIANPRMQSMHTFALSTTGSPALAWAAHAALAAVVLAVVLRLWLRRPESSDEARAAAAIAGAFLITPYVWTYDTPAIAIAALFLARAGRRDGWLAAEKVLLIAACLVIALVLVLGNHALVAPAGWLLILACAWRRDRAFRLSPAQTGLPSAGT